ncbi:MAG: hypothetical protein ACE5GE_16860 [Phycisphaerae bacterium]
MTQSSSISGEQRAGLFSLAVAVAVALLVWCGWWLLREEPPPVARQRAFHQIQVRWLCDNGDEFTSFGAFGPRRCPQCKADAFVVARYQCPVHGEFDVRLRHVRGTDDRPVLSAICFSERAWEDPTDGVRCPTCERRMLQTQVDVFANRKDKHKNRGRQP